MGATPMFTSYFYTLSILNMPIRVQFIIRIDVTKLKFSEFSKIPDTDIHRIDLNRAVSQSC